MSGTTTAYFKHGHGQEPVILRTAEDADVLVDAMLNEEFGNSVAALYADARPPMEAAADLPDHELRIALYAEAKVGGIRYAVETRMTPRTFQDRPASAKKSSITTWDTTRGGHKTLRSRSSKCERRSRSS